MKKKDFKTIKLAKGEVDLYHEGDIDLHVYKTNDPINDVTLILEREKRAVVIEPPCFVDNLTELEGYIHTSKLEVEGLLMAYHMTGENFIRKAKRYSTKNAEAFGRNGQGKAIVDSFAQTFGSAFDSSINQVNSYIGGDRVCIAGIEMFLEQTEEAFDIEFPAINAKYIHSLGHDVHSIISGKDNLDAELAKLERCVKKGYSLILTSHYPPEDLEDVREKISYLTRLRDAARDIGSAEEFKQTLRREYPQYGGLHYLDMTTQALYGA